jgi:hypothetical protein
MCRCNHNVNVNANKQVLSQRTTRGGQCAKNETLSSGTPESFRNSKVIQIIGRTADDDDDDHAMRRQPGSVVTLQHHGLTVL